MQGTAFDLERKLRGERRQARLNERFKEIKMRRLREGLGNTVL